MSFCDNDNYHDYCDNKRVVQAYKCVQMRAATDTTQIVLDNYREDLADEWAEFEVDRVSKTLKPGRGPTPSATDKDCFVAIYHDDTEFKDMYDFYIMYVTEGPVQLGSELRRNGKAVPWMDDNKSVFESGSTVVKGRYFSLAPCSDNPNELMPEDEGTYVLDQRTSWSHLLAVFHCGFDVDIDNSTALTRYILSERTQEEIRSHLAQRLQNM